MQGNPPAAAPPLPVREKEGGEVCERKVLTVAEAAELLRADRRAISAMCEQGRIQCMDIGKHRGHHVWRIHKDVIERELGGRL